MRAGKTTKDGFERCLRRGAGLQDCMVVRTYIRVRARYVCARAPFDVVLTDFDILSAAPRLRV